MFQSGLWMVICGYTRLECPQTTSFHRTNDLKFEVEGRRWVKLKPFTLPPFSHLVSNRVKLLAICFFTSLTLRTKGVEHIFVHAGAIRRILKILWTSPLSRPARWWFYILMSFCYVIYSYFDDFRMFYSYLCNKTPVQFTL